MGWTAMRTDLLFWDIVFNDPARDQEKCGRNHFLKMMLPEGSDQRNDFSFEGTAFELESVLKS
jgi:hypothetical protein